MRDLPDFDNPKPVPYLLTPEDEAEADAWNAWVDAQVEEEEAFDKWFQETMNEAIMQVPPEQVAQILLRLAVPEANADDDAKPTPEL